MAITGLQALGVGKKYTNQVALGLSNITIDNEKGKVTFELNDGSTASWTFPKPANGKDGKNGTDGVDGISVISVEQPDSRHFRCVFSDGSKSQLITLPVGQGGGTSLASEVFLTDGTDVETQFGKVQTEIDGLFDVAGNIVYGTVETYADLLEVDTSKFEKGVYLYLVKQDENYPKDDDENYSTLYLWLTSNPNPTWNFVGKLNVSEKMMAEMIKTAITTALMNYYTKTELLNMAEEWTFTLEDGSTVTKKIGVFADV